MVFENGKKVFYVVVLRAIYGILVALLLFYKKYIGDLENVAFDFNPYYPYVANRIKVSKQHKMRFYVEYVSSSVLNPEVKGDFNKSMNCN